MNKELPFKTVKRAHLYEKVASQIEKAIFDGVLKPDESLPSERELVEKFGVGRPVLREALRILQAKGLIDINPGVKGSTVRKINLTHYLENIRETLACLIHMDQKTIKEVWVVREYVELGIAHSVARNATQQDFDDLESLIRQMEECGNDIHSYFPIAIEFHQELARKSGNRVFYIIRNMLHDVLIKRYMPILDDVFPQGPKELLEANRALLAAIKSRDPHVINKELLEGDRALLSGIPDTINQALEKHTEMDRPLPVD